MYGDAYCGGRCRYSGAGMAFDEVDISALFVAKLRSRGLLLPPFPRLGVQRRLLISVPAASRMSDAACAIGYEGVAAAAVGVERRCRACGHKPRGYKPSYAGCRHAAPAAEGRFRLPPSHLPSRPTMRFVRGSCRRCYLSTAPVLALAMNPPSATDAARVVAVVGGGILC